MSTNIDHRRLEIERVLDGFILRGLDGPCSHPSEQPTTVAAGPEALLAWIRAWALAHEDAEVANEQAVARAQAETAAERPRPGGSARGMVG